MEKARCCRHCGCAIRFCPCCGAELAGKRDNAVKGLSSDTGGRLSSCNYSFSPHTAADRAEGSGTPAPCCHSTSAWRERLPHRAVSAYEVYLAIVHGFVVKKGDEEADAARAVALTPAAASVAEGGQHNDEQMRGAALSWLRMMPAEKRVYEVEAQLWQARLATVSREPTTSAVAVATALRSSTAAPPLVHNLKEGSSSAAAELYTLPLAERLLPQQPASRLVAKVSSKTLTSERLPRSKTSFALFRANVKGRRKMSMKEIAAVWRHMSAEEKAPYDSAAANQRTEQLLSQTPSAPGSQS
ncbi:hypothetical protein, conserved [Leishmania lindenbergi]|uniref:HMG box domain-containing protein n=1 Tax=Leishmania lindenbergi TaxID=651832 RepID=A0AAW3AGK4_9TRYP